MGHSKHFCTKCKELSQNNKCTKCGLPTFGVHHSTRFPKHPKKSDYRYMAMAILDKKLVEDKYAHGLEFVKKYYNGHFDLDRKIVEWKKFTNNDKLFNGNPDEFKSLRPYSPIYQVTFNALLNKNTTPIVPNRTLWCCRAIGVFGDPSFITVLPSYDNLFDIIECHSFRKSDDILVLIKKTKTSIRDALFFDSKSACAEVAIFVAKHLMALDPNEQDIDHGAKEFLNKMQNEFPEHIL